MCVSNIKTSKKGVESIFYSTFSPILIIPHYSLETIIKENWPRVSSSDFTLRAKFCIKKLILKCMNYFFFCLIFQDITLDWLLSSTNW